MRQTHKKHSRTAAGGRETAEAKHKNGARLPPHQDGAHSVAVAEPEHVWEPPEENEGGNVPSRRKNVVKASLSRLRPSKAAAAVQYRLHSGRALRGRGGHAPRRRDALQRAEAGPRVAPLERLERVNDAVIGEGPGLLRQETFAAVSGLDRGEKERTSRATRERGGGFRGLSGAPVPSDHSTRQDRLRRRNAGWPARGTTRKCRSRPVPGMQRTGVGCRGRGAQSADRRRGRMATP